jgi:hypothetical protein
MAQPNSLIFGSVVATLAALRPFGNGVASPGVGAVGVERYPVYKNFARYRRAEVCELRAAGVSYCCNG